MDMYQLSHAIERHVASFARAVTCREAPAAPAPAPTAEVAALQADLHQVTALYEESLCVWDHEMGLLQARVDRLQKENDQMGREARLLSGQLRAAWRTRPINERRGVLSRALRRILRWTNIYSHSSER